MANGEKVVLRLGFIATHCLPMYKRERIENIKRNNEVCISLGVKRITPSSIGLVQHKRANAKAKVAKHSSGKLDGEYRPQEDEDDHDDNESRDSFEQETIDMPPDRRPTESYPEPQCGDNVISDRVTRSTPQPNMDSQSIPPPIAQPQSKASPNNNVAAINRRTRGPTRGKQIQRLIDKKGTLPVVIPPQFRLPVGEHAARLASKIGVEVRTHVMDLGVHRWKAVDDTVKAPILQRLTDKFDLQGNPIDVDKIVAKQCGRTLSSFSYRLHKKYQKLKDTKGEEYARNNPPSYVKPEQWTSLIEKKWMVEKWQVRSEKNQKNRTTDNAKNKCKYRCGSKSLSVRVAAAMQENEDGVPALAVIYKSTHFNGDSNEWITPESEIIHDKMEQIEAEHNSQDGAIPITQEELSIKVFGPRSGYVKGLGMRPSSSIRSIVEFSDNGKYVTQLEKKVQEQADQIHEQANQIQEQANKIQEQAEGIEASKNKIHDLIEAKEEQGRNLASVMEYLKRQGYTS